MASLGAEFQARLAYTLVEETLVQVEIELIEVRTARFLCNFPWVPGKRLRPITFLLSNLCVRLDKSRPTTLGKRESQLAAAIELLHEASLVHDDLVDRSQVRRGVPTVQMNGGQGLALLIGDYMVFRGLKMVLDAAESREDILLAKELANTGLSIAHGEADQLDRYLNRRQEPNPMSLELYLDIIAKKTAAFFAGCAEAGAALGGADPPLRHVFREFGMSMGLLFQMLDDLMDIAGDPEVARKSLRNNVDEGTITLPMIQAHALHPRNRALKALARGEPLTPIAQQGLYEMLASPAVLERCKALMGDYFDKARAWLDHMPANIYRLGLYDLLEYVASCAWGGMPAPGNEGRKRQ